MAPVAAGDAVRYSDKQDPLRLVSIHRQEGCWKMILPPEVSRHLDVPMLDTLFFTVKQTFPWLPVQGCGFIVKSSMRPTGGNRAENGVYVAVSSDESEDSRDIDPDYVPIRRRSGNRSGSSTTSYLARKTINDYRPRRRRNHNQTCEDYRLRIINPGPMLLQSAPESQTILSWLINCTILREAEEVTYGQGGLSGTVMQKKANAVRGRLHCDCCSKVMTPSEFEIHANGVSSGMPYAHIFVPSWNSHLLSCQEMAWNSDLERQRRSSNVIVRPPGLKDDHDFVCLICGDGGNLICCENCPSTYHSDCMGMKELPKEDWVCPYCVCKYCGAAENLTECSQCSKQYHWDCVVKAKEIDLNSKAGVPCCSRGCTQVYDTLQELVGIKNQLEDGFSWTLLHRIDLDDSSMEERYLKVECNFKVAVAYQVMNECFTRNIDRLAKVDTVQSVTYSRESNFMRFNFKEFYTAILEKNDETISVASIRLHGTELAEMPYISTRHHFRDKGMTKMLLLALESVLANMGIKHLVIPSVRDLVRFWKSKFGFRSVDQDVMNKLMNLNTVMFTGTVRLQKSLLSSHQSTAAAGPSCSTAFSAATNASNIGANAVIHGSLDLNLNAPGHEEELEQQANFLI